MSTVTGPRPRTERLRGRTATTPERLRVAMAIVIAALLGAALVAAHATNARRSAAEAVAARDEPVMVEAAALYATPTPTPRRPRHFSPAALNRRCAGSGTSLTCGSRA